MVERPGSRDAMEYGPAAGKVFIPDDEYGVFGLIAVNHCMPRIDTKVAFGFVRWKTSVLPFAEMPEMCCAFPARKSAPPATTSWRSRFGPRGEPIFGLSTRSKARWNDAAVTFDPSEKRSPGRMWNVYVFPSFETDGKAVAASG